MPETLLVLSRKGEVVVPRYFGESDHPWLDSLLAERERHVGRRQRELDERLREPPSGECPLAKWKLAVHVLARVNPRTRPLGLSPPEARAALFLEAARGPEDLPAAFQRTAAALGVTPEALDATLFADLPGERKVQPFKEPPQAATLAARANAALASGVLDRAMAVRIEAENAEQGAELVRFARRRRLILEVGAGSETALEISGPFGLFRHTRLYGRALGQLLDRLAGTGRFRLVVQCVVRGRETLVQMTSDDPIAGGSERSHLAEGQKAGRRDSSMRKFAAGMRRAAPNWRLVDAGEAGQFSIARLGAEYEVRVEVAGFWTAAHALRRRAELSATASIPSLLCLDETLNCGEFPLPPEPGILLFRTRLEAEAVVRAVEALLG